MSSIVEAWFGEQFKLLHPLLQQLHREGGSLCGTVAVTYGTGFARVFAKRLAKKLGIPGEGEHPFLVSIKHENGTLLWTRSFGEGSIVESTFTPVGHLEDGYWQENLGPLNFRLSVDILRGGWYWRPLSFHFYGIPIPIWLFPQSTAYKFIEDGRYRFFVGFRLPFIGDLITYSGLLSANPD